MAAKLETQILAGLVSVIEILKRFWSVTGRSFSSYKARQACTTVVQRVTNVLKVPQSVRHKSKSRYEI